MKMLKFAFPYICLLLFTINNIKAQENKKTINNNTQKLSFAQVESSFINAPDSIQTSVYWYWISGNLSKEGVIKDLEAMKKVGINRAFIGDIGLSDVPYGNVKFRSVEWWDILHTALKTATRLNIQIGIFNGPGWSQSGGPWVAKEQSMRYLNSSQIEVRGPISYHQILTKPQDNFQDVKVLAYPVPLDYDTDIGKLKPIISSSPKIDSLDNLMDNNLATGIHLSRDQTLNLNIDTKKEYTIRSLSLSMLHQAVYLEGDIQVKIENTYKTVKHFTIDRRGPALNHGFLPWARAVVSIPTTTSHHFRIVLTKVSSNSGISELRLSSTPMIDSYMEKTLAKMWQTEDLLWNAYMWEIQADDPSKYIIDPKRVLDISKYMTADGTINWKVPAGNWIIERTGLSPTGVSNVPATPEATGLEVDKLSKLNIRKHFDDYLGEILNRIPPEDRKTFSVVVADSYETGSQNWTDTLIPEFKAKFNYDPIPFIPTLSGKVIGSADQSERFLWDLRRLIADQVAYNYIGELTKISHEHGLTTWLENYGYFGFPGEFLQYGGQSDEVAGEFWTEGHLGGVENRAAASAAHIYSKTKVSSESFTAAGNPWRKTPASLKARADRFFTEGINNTLLHVYIHQPELNPKPGLAAWFGTEFNRANTWFYDMDVFLKYLKRCNMMLQQGQYVADVAYFIGEDAPKLIGTTDPELPRGYSFDYINAEVIKNMLSVSDGKLILPNGLNYSLLVLPKQTTIRPELLIKIKELVQNGAVVLGPRPERSPSLQDQPAADLLVKTIANELWGNIDGKSNKVNKVGKGMVISGMNMQEALDLLKITPDFISAGNIEVPFIHRQMNDGSIYFISNQKKEPVRFDAQFRVNGKSPELWDAVTGTLRDLQNFKQTASGTVLPIELAPNGSAFIIFRKASSIQDGKGTNYPVPKDSIDVNGPWKVTFDKEMGGLSQPIIFDNLTDWATNVNDSIKFYSGAARYQNSFRINKIEKGRNYIIDLGLAKDIAKITLNGIEIGGTWTPPYQIDITSALKVGENKLEVKVVNTWVNRLLGDDRLPTNQRKITSPYRPDPKAGLMQSGLLGPVKILSY